MFLSDVSGMPPVVSAAWRQSCNAAHVVKYRRQKHQHFIIAVLCCRPLYASLGHGIRQACGSVAALALTATASDAAIKGIKSALRMAAVRVVKAPMFRANLVLTVQERAHRNTELAQLCDTIASTKQLVVVFCIEKSTCEKLCVRVMENFNGIRAAAFRGGLEASTRDNMLAMCRHKILDVLFSTLAVRLGVHVPVNTVIHWDVP